MYPCLAWRPNMLRRVCSRSVPNRTRTLELFPRMQTAEPLVLLRVPMDGRAASFRLQSGPEAGISRIKFAVIVIVRLDRATSASSPSTSASFTKGHFMRQDGPPLLPFNRIRTRPALASVRKTSFTTNTHHTTTQYGKQIRRTLLNVTKPTLCGLFERETCGGKRLSLRGGALPSHLEPLCNVQPLVEPLLALELHRC